MTPEGRVKAKVKRRLDELLQRYRFMPVQNGMGSPALDFYCCIHSRFVAIETKAPGKKMTDRQRHTASEIEAAGGLVFEVYDDASIDVMMARLWLMIEFDRECNSLAEASGRTRPVGSCWDRGDVP